MEIMSIVGIVDSQPIEIFSENIRHDYVCFNVKCYSNKITPPNIYIIHVFSKKQMEFSLGLLKIGDKIAISGKLIIKKSLKQDGLHFDLIVNTNHLERL